MLKEFPLFGSWFKKSGGNHSVVSPRPVFLVWFVCLSFLGGVGLFSGCTSDLPSDVGTGLVSDQIGGVFDEVLDTLVLREIELFNGKNFREDELPLAEQEVLYLGAQDGTESSILLNYDFSSVFTDSFPESKWTMENITSVRLRILMLEFYGSMQTVEEETKSDKALAKYYEVFELDEEFNPGEFPGPVPDHGDALINTELDLNDEEYLDLELQIGHLLSWVASETTQGLVVSERVDEGSIEGLVGFSSREMLHPASSLIDYHEDTLVAPIIVVHFAHNDSSLFIEPSADTSTFHVVSEAPSDPTDGMVLRTCLRNYPVMRFDFSTLPPNIFINRAVLSVTNDTTTSFGNTQSIVVSEFDTDWFGSPGDTMSLADLPDKVYQLSGMNSLVPEYHGKMEFNVTTAVQRIVNNVYDGQRGFIMTAGEDIFQNYDLDAVDPDFYFTQFNFFGTGASENLRPKLKIAYTRINSLDGGDE